MRSFGWSAKNKFPCSSQVGPSVKAKSPASFCSLAPGATTLSAAAGINTAISVANIAGSHFMRGGQFAASAASNPSKTRLVFAGWLAHVEPAIFAAR
jgi:hypothetical protein